MKYMKQAALFLLAVSAGVLLGGCATGTTSASLYDFGPLRSMPSTAAHAALPPISVAEIGTPAWLDTPLMFYRLNYANDQQPRSYANSRWTMPPAQLFGQRLKSRIAQAGGAVLDVSDGALNVPVLRIDADEFSHTFDTQERSFAQVGLRATLFDGRRLVAQKTFIKQAPAPSADASGGARALAAASDAIITEMIAWLAELPSTSK